MMRWIVGVGVVMTLAAGCVSLSAEKSATQRQAINVGFETQAVDAMPEGFTPAVTGPGAPGVWMVREDATTKNGIRVLVQESADPTRMRFPLLICNAVTAKDVNVSVRFKPISGKIDQAAGIVVRYQDKDNYYIARANALENNVRLYKVENGQRKQFAGVDTPTPASGLWHTLTLKVVENYFEVGMNGQKLFEAEDATFTQPGKVALWTKADSVMEFDELRIEPLTSP